MRYFQNILEKFSKTEKEKADLKRLKSFTEHIHHVLAVNKQNGITNAALVISKKQSEDAQNEIKKIKNNIRQRRLKALI